MKCSLAIKGLDCALRGALGRSFLLAGAVTLGLAGCGGNGMADLTPDLSPPTNTVPTSMLPAMPYSPAYPPRAPQVQRGTDEILTAPHVVPVFFNGDKLQTQLAAFVKSYLTGSAAWQVLQEYGIGAGTVAPATVLTQTLSAAL